MIRKIFLLVLSTLCGPSWAETLTLEQAVERALSADPRIEERRHMVDAARALLQEAQGNDDLIFDVNAIVGVAPTYDDGFFANGTETCTSPCKLAEGTYDFEGLSLLTNLQFAIIKPLNTFGKIENYADAAKGNISIKNSDVRLQRIKTRMDVMRAYYGYLTARDTRKLLTDVKRRVGGAERLLKKWLDEGTGDSKQSDLFSLQTGAALIERYLLQAEALEKIALGGLKVLTGVGLNNPLEVADQRLRPVKVPADSLAQLQERALQLRPEMDQLKAGLGARRSLVAAKKAEKNPNLYAGVVGSISYAPDRYQVDNPYVYDPFNHAALTPMIGINWQWSSGVQPARVAGAQADLNALIEKAAFARDGIPYQVAEQFYQVQAYEKIVKALERGSRSGRRWMVTSYADFEAGLDEASKIVEAFKGYVLAHSDYLLSVNEFNMHVAKLMQVTGNYK